MFWHQHLFLCTFVICISTIVINCFQAFLAAETVILLQMQMQKCRETYLSSADASQNPGSGSSGSGLSLLSRFSFSS